MTIMLNDSNITNISQLETFLSVSEVFEVDAKCPRKERADWIYDRLVRFKYQTLGKKEKGILFKYLRKVTGYSREQKEGSLFLSQKGNKAALIMLNCETDFVARNPDFQKFGKGLADILLNEGEPALKKNAEESLPAIVQKLGENISLGAAHVIEAPVLGSYIHTNSKIAVIIGLDKGDIETARDAAMHAAAMNPLFRTPEQVSAEAIEKEKEIWKSQLKAEGKPEQIWDKIMAGKEKKFREENALISQVYVKDPSKKVKDRLGGAEVVEYLRVAVE